MAGPTITLVVTSFERPDKLVRAVRSGTRQAGFASVVVVDDGSRCRSALDGLPRDVRVIRHTENLGVSAARNAGIEAATTSHVVFLDDDDRLLPWAARAWHAWLGRSRDPDAIAVGSILVGRPGRLPSRRVPPRSSPGTIWGLDPAPLGTSFATKQAAVLPLSLVRRVGGFDTELRSRVTSELFYRLSAQAPITGHATPIYWLDRGAHRKITDDRARRETSAAYIRHKHAALLSDPTRRRAFEANHDAMVSRSV